MSLEPFDTRWFLITLLGPTCIGRFQIHLCARTFSIENLYRQANKRCELCFFPPLKQECYLLTQSEGTIFKNGQLERDSESRILLEANQGSPNLCFVWSFQEKWAKNLYIASVCYGRTVS